MVTRAGQPHTLWSVTYIIMVTHSDQQHVSSWSLSMVSHTLHHGHSPWSTPHIFMVIRAGQPDTLSVTSPGQPHTSWLLILVKYTHHGHTPVVILWSSIQETPTQ